MKKVFLLVGVFGVFLGCGLSSCASTKILTPGAIEDDIAGISNLAYCQFFLSKDVTLRFLSDSRETGIQETSGTVQAERTIIRRTIRIASSTPGILQTRNNAGDILDGYLLWIPTGREQVQLNLLILFDEDNDNIIEFAAIYDIMEHKFIIAGNTVIYGGITYSINYEGDERPYLLYKIVERTKEINEDRRARGRRVGS